MEKTPRSLYISMFFGIVALALLVFPLAGAPGNGYLYLVYSFPVAIIGMFASFIAGFKCRNKKLLWIAFCLNFVPVAFLLVAVILLLSNKDAFRQ
jgi:hypothetical protein